MAHAQLVEDPEEDEYTEVDSMEEGDVEYEDGEELVDDGEYDEDDYTEVDEDEEDLSGQEIAERAGIDYMGPEEEYEDEGPSGEEIAESAGIDYMGPEEEEELSGAEIADRAGISYVGSEQGYARQTPTGREIADRAGIAYVGGGNVTRPSYNPPAPVEKRQPNPGSIIGRMVNEPRRTSGVIQRIANEPKRPSIVQRMADSEPARRRSGVGLDGKPAESMVVRMMRGSTSNTPQLKEESLVRRMMRGGAQVAGGASRLMAAAADSRMAKATVASAVEPTRAPRFVSGYTPGQSSSRPGILSRYAEADAQSNRKTKQALMMLSNQRAPRSQSQSQLPASREATQLTTTQTQRSIPMNTPITNMVEYIRDNFDNLSPERYEQLAQVARVADTLPPGDPKREYALEYFESVTRSLKDNDPRKAVLMKMIAQIRGRVNRAPAPAEVGEEEEEGEVNIHRVNRRVSHKPTTIYEEDVEEEHAPVNIQRIKRKNKVTPYTEYAEDIDEEESPANIQNIRQKRVKRPYTSYAEDVDEDESPVAIQEYRQKSVQRPYVSVKSDVDEEYSPAQIEEYRRKLVRKPHRAISDYVDVEESPVDVQDYQAQYRQQAFDQMQAYNQMQAQQVLYDAYGNPVQVRAPMQAVPPVQYAQAAMLGMAPAGMAPAGFGQLLPFNGGGFYASKNRGVNVNVKTDCGCNGNKQRSAPRKAKPKPKAKPRKKCPKKCKNIRVKAFTRSDGARVRAHIRRICC